MLKFQCNGINLTNSSLIEHRIKIDAWKNYQLLHAKNIQCLLKMINPWTPKLSNRQSKKELKLTVEVTTGKRGGNHLTAESMGVNEFSYGEKQKSKRAKDKIVEKSPVGGKSRKIVKHID